MLSSIKIENLVGKIPTEFGKRIGVTLEQIRRLEAEKAEWMGDVQKDSDICKAAIAQYKSQIEDMQAELTCYKLLSGDERLEKAVPGITEYAESWLRNHPAPDEKRFFSGESSYSAKDLVGLIKQYPLTPEGLFHVQIFERMMNGVRPGDICPTL